MSVSVISLGAKGDGITDDTYAIRNAVASGQSVYFPGTQHGYLITDQIISTVPGQVFEGDDRSSSWLKIMPNFNMAAAGVMVCTSGEPGFVLRRLGIRFTQPDTASLAEIIPYPTAVHAVSQPRFKIAECQITNAWTGVNMVGNSGGAYIDDLQLSTYSVGIDIDGSLDNVRLSRVHHWPFGMTANQASIDYSNAAAVRSARCDGLFLESCLFLCANQLILYRSANGVTFGSATNCDFDTFTGVIMRAGNFSFLGGIFSVGDDRINIYCNGGVLRVFGADILHGATGTSPAICLDTSGADVTDPIYATISGCTFDTSAADARSVLINAAPAYIARVTMSDCHFKRVANVPYGLPTLDVLGSAVLSMSNCRMPDKGTGDGVFLHVQKDNWHRIIGNAAPGWRNVLPAAGSSVYAFN